MPSLQGPREHELRVFVRGGRLEKVILGVYRVGQPIGVDVNARAEINCMLPDQATHMGVSVF